MTSFLFTILYYLTAETETGTETGTDTDEASFSQLMTLFVQICFDTQKVKNDNKKKEAAATL